MKKDDSYADRAIKTQCAENCGSSSSIVMFPQGGDLGVGGGDSTEVQDYKFITQKWRHGHRQKAGRERTTKKRETTEI